MDEQTLLPEIKALIVRELRLKGVKPEDIGDDEPLFREGLGLDSLDALELASALETHFRIPVPDEAMAAEAFRSARGIARYVLSHTASSPGA